MSLRSVLKLTTPVRAWVVFVGRVVDWSGLLFDSLGTSKRGSTIACNAELAYDYHLSFIFCCLLSFFTPRQKYIDFVGILLLCASLLWGSWCHVHRCVHALVGVLSRCHICVIHVVSFFLSSLPAGKREKYAEVHEDCFTAMICGLRRVHSSAYRAKY